MDARTLCLLVAVLVACDSAGGDDDGGAIDYEPFMDWGRWEALTGADPHASADAGMGSDPGCSERAFSVATDRLQTTPGNPAGLVPTIATNACPFVTATQSTTRALEVGERIVAAVFQTRLHSLVPASARIAVRIGDHPVLDVEEAIDAAAPHDECAEAATTGYCAKAARLTGTWTVDTPVPEGTPLYFHVDNHGDNEYWLVELRPETD